jgi:hypothetical protein
MLAGGPWEVGFPMHAHVRSTWGPDLSKFVTMYSVDLKHAGGWALGGRVFWSNAPTRHIGPTLASPINMVPCNISYQTSNERQFILIALVMVNVDNDTLLVAHVS